MTRNIKTDYSRRAALAAAPVQPTQNGPEIDRLIDRLMSSDPDFDDCTKAAELIQREIKGPDGYATWRDAAIEERQRRVAAAPAQSDTHPTTGEPMGTDAQEATAWKLAAENLERENAALRDALLKCAQAVESLKRPCSMDPESFQAIRNSEYMGISYAMRAALAGTAPAPMPDQIPTDAELLALNAGEVHFSESPTKYPEAGHGTQYHAGAPGILGFARDILAKWGSPVVAGEPVAWAATSEDGDVEALGMNQSRRFDTPLYTAAQALAMGREPQIEKAAKVLAECMDYPWEHMPEKGRQAMREHAQKVLSAAHNIKQGGQHGADT